MRICDVNNNYSPTGGGVRTYHHEKIRYIRAHPQHTYCLVVPSDRETWEQDGNIIHAHVPAVALGGSGYRMIVRSNALKRMLKRFAPDVIEIGSAYIMPGLVRRAVGARVPTVGFYHADYPDTYVRPLASKLGSGIARLATQAATRHSGATYDKMTAMFGASAFVLNKLRAAGVQRLFKTPLGVDVDRFSPDRRSEQWRQSVLGIGSNSVGSNSVGSNGNSDKPIVLYLARLAPEKGTQLLIDAYPRLRDPSRFQLVIGGHGPLEGAVDALCARYPEIHRIGYIADPDELATVYASADVFLSLSPYETFNIAALESMASGVPVIAPDAGGAGEIVRSTGAGAQFVADDVGSLAAALDKTLCQLRESRDGPDNSSTQGPRNAASRHTWTHTFDREFALYAHIIAAHRMANLAPLQALSDADRAGW